MDSIITNNSITTPVEPKWKQHVNKYLVKHPGAIWQVVKPALMTESYLDLFNNLIMNPTYRRNYSKLFAHHSSYIMTADG